MQCRSALKIVVLSLVGFAQAAVAQHTAGSVVQAGPGVTVQGLSTQSGTVLIESSKIKTSAGSTAQLQLTDGGVALLAKNTDLTVTEYRYEPFNADEGRASLFLADGRLRMITGAIPKSAAGSPSAPPPACSVTRAADAPLEPGDFVVATPYGTFSPKGTDFTVSVCSAACAAKGLQKEGAYLHVDAGTVTAQGSSGCAVIQAGNDAVIYPNGTVELLDSTPNNIGGVLPDPVIPILGPGSLVRPVDPASPS